MINMLNRRQKKIYIGNAEQCLREAEQLIYAYFSPELDNFEEEITVDDILFKVICEIDNLDDGDAGLTKEEINDAYEYGDQDFRWNTNRNRAWRRKAIALLHKWGEEAGEGKDTYLNMQ